MTADLTWGTRIGSGEILTLEEAGTRYSISSESLRVRKGGGQWRPPTDDEFRYLGPWGTRVEDPA